MSSVRRPFAPIGLHTGDGRVLVTVQQLVDRLGLDAAAIRACLRRHEALAARIGDGPTQLLIIRPEGMAALRRRAA